jgi:hypothetical protein
MTVLLEPHEVTADEPDEMTSTSRPTDRTSGRISRRSLIVIRPARIALTLALIVVALATLSTAARMLMLQFDPAQYGGLQEIAWRFDLDHENNIPTWFSSSMMLCCGGLLFLIALASRRARRPFVLHWVLLAVIFVYLSIDESAYLHEILIEPLRRRLGAGGLLYFTWVVPGFAAVAVLGAVFVRFLLHLDRRSLVLFVAAGAMFVGGALGMELIGGALAESNGLDSLPYTAAMTCEEVLELLGMGLFLYALLDYLRRHHGSWQFHLAPVPAAEQ